MKKVVKSYLTFTRAERIGLLCLCSLILIFTIVKATMHLWVHPDVDEAQQKKLATAWEAFQRSQPQETADTAAVVQEGYKDAPGENNTPLPETIDLNTADSSLLVRLKGIGPVTAHKIVERRKKRGPFTDISQLSEVGAFTADNLALLKKHLIIK